MTQSKRQLYQSYLLHCWQERNGLLPGHVWRFSLEDPDSHQQQDFPNLRELIMALNTELIESRYHRPATARSQAVPTDQTPRLGGRPRQEAGVYPVVQAEEVRSKE